MTAEKATEYSDSCRSQISSKTIQYIGKVLEDFKELMQKIDADEKKIREDGEKRAKEEEEMKKAELTKGEEKIKIFEQAKLKESEMKQKEEAIKQITGVTDDKNKGTGSVWNPNSYFWEEKNLNKWSQDKLHELFDDFKHTVPNGSLRIIQCEIKGDSSISIRKGKKIFSFDFDIDLKWKIDLKENDDESAINGHFKLPEVSNLVYDEEEAFVINIEYKTGEENRDKVHDHLRGPISDAIRKNLEKY